MEETQFRLLKTRRFLPLFITQFFGAFNDNLFKNALVILITYKILIASPQKAELMVTLAFGFFILPFFLFSATAGQLADKYQKPLLIRIIKFFEIPIMALAVLGFTQTNLGLLLVCLFLMGTHSTFFGPLKYAILPEHLKENELIGGNALIETGTFLAILLGTIIGGTLISTKVGVLLISFSIILVAFMGWLTSFFIPALPPAQPHLKINLNFIKETFNIIRYTKNQKTVFLSILGISWFWFVGAIFLAQFPNYSRDILKANAHVVTLFLAIFSIGIGFGSLLCNRLLHSEITAKYVPLGVLGMSFFIFDIYQTSLNITLHPASELVSVFGFLTTLTGWRLLADMFMVSLCGGIFVVPLYAIMQYDSLEEHRARNIACNNILNALFMVVSAIVTVILLKLRFTISEVFLTIGVINAFVALYICKILPDAVVKSFIRWVLQLCFRVKVEGLENYKMAGERVIIISNHTSFLDVVLLAAYLPNRLCFAVNTHIAQQWWMKPILTLVQTFQIDPTNPMAMKSLIEEVKKNKKCVIFPEGRLTATGALMKVYEGPGMVADKSEAMLLPVRLDGVQYTFFSRLKGKVNIRWFPDIKLTILPPRKLGIDKKVKGRQRRELISIQLYDLMTTMMFESSEYKHPLFASLLEARKIHGGRHPIAEDVNRKVINYNRFITGTFILGKHINKTVDPKKPVGILMPNVVSTAVLFFGAQAYGRVTAMLNYSTGISNVVKACETAKINVIYTSKKFIETANLQEMIDTLKKENIQFIYLEDLSNKIKFYHKITAMLKSQFAGFIYQSKLKKITSKAPALILFTSGSEGAPKGVVLSHNNVQANRFQLSAIVDFNPQDIIFNALPMFHSFGLTAGAILPLLSGIKVFFYPSPLHYRIVPELCYDSNATILFGTDTFLAGYAKYAHPYDFYSVRYIFSGAEKLKPETSQIWSEKFGIRIFEGYGATETAPVLATNTPMQHQFGSVGRFLPGIQYRVEVVKGIEEGGRLYVKGPNIMMGYLKHNHPGVLEPLEKGWYDTGDIVSVDDYGYITIMGRAKRFAKIAGEMVSLTAVEQFISKLWPEYQHAVLSQPDPKKGEQLILLTDYQDASRDKIITFCKKNGIGEISIPKHVKIISEVPLLGSGKVDYVRSKIILEEMLNASI